MPESLKNILLVMSAGGYLTPPNSDTQSQSEQQRKLWSETWTRLNRFLPDLMPELFPEETRKPSKVVVPEVKAEVQESKEAEAQAGHSEEAGEKEAHIADTEAAAA